MCGIQIISWQYLSNGGYWIDVILGSLTVVVVIITFGSDLNAEETRWHYIFLAHNE
jgi:hypothetical protein